MSFPRNSAHKEEEGYTWIRSRRMGEHEEKRRYTRELKLGVVRLYESSGKSMRAIQQELGITPYLPSKWVQ